jgi:hypothetical protein
MRPGIVTLRFTSRWPYNPISLAIACLTDSREGFSHVMAIIEGRAYEANMLHGCRAVPVEVAMAGMVRWQDMPVAVPDLDAAIAFGEAQCGGNGQHGKPYDWPGAFGLPLLRSEDWADGGKWWCSELAFALLMAGGTTLLDPQETKRVTPNDLRQCNYPKLALTYA